MMFVPGIVTLSGLAAGSAIGGLTSGATTWMNQRSQARASQIAHEFSRREDLYRDFIVAASKAYGEAMVSNKPQIQELIALYAMISRMRVLSSPETVAGAQKIMVLTIATYSSPNKSVPELHDLLESGDAIDPLKEFAEAARVELRGRIFRNR